MYSDTDTASVHVDILTLCSCTVTRPRPIMLKILPIMLLSSAQKISLLCSIFTNLKNMQVLTGIKLT